MNVVAFIPSRYGSTRFEGKPLADICGKPMVRWVYECAQKARLVTDVAVATDDERIARAVEAFGGKAVMTSALHRSGTDRLAEAAASVDAGIIVNLQGDEPLMEPGMIDDAIAPMLEEPDLCISTLKTRITEEEEYRNPNAVKVVTDRSGYALYFSRSPIPHMKGAFGTAAAYKHIGLYVYRRAFLLKFPALAPTPLEEAERLEQMRALENGVRIKVVETSCNPVAVDTPEDLERVRAIVEGRGPAGRPVGGSAGRGGR
ncbi:MAG: 3-deoxy-manno-octulosonate cytidylyltransferase [Thermodesulfobacteriota bacterium]